MSSTFSSRRGQLLANSIRTLSAVGLLAIQGLATAQNPIGPLLPGQRGEPEQPVSADPPTPPATVPDTTIDNGLRTASLSAPGEPANLRPIAAPAALEAMSARSMPAHAVTAAIDESAFVPLLAANDLTGWTVHEGRAGTWTRSGEILRAQGTGAGWLMTDQTYSDYILRFEYRLEAGTNSGVAVRCAPVGNPTFTGMEIQLLDDAAPKYAGLRPTQYTGSLYYRIAPHVKAVLAPRGEWNTCEVRCVASQLEIAINGAAINSIALRSQPESQPAEGSEVVPTSFNSSPWNLAERPPLGRIALQSHPAGVEFRKLMILDVTHVTESGLRVVELAPGHSGDEPATTSDTVVLHYIGQLPDGKVFTNTYEHGAPITVALEDVIDGWKEGIVGMKPGARRRLIVPAALAYGAAGVENLIPPDSTLVFDIELQRVER